MTTNLRWIILSLLISTSIFSCKDDDDASAPDNQDQTNFEIPILEGTVQKGPFNTGTTVTIRELDANLVQTGRSFGTQITSNSGSFKLNNLSLESPFVEILADGFYFNEVNGANSSSQLTLRALSDIRDSAAINVNVLTTLEKPRVEQLIANGVPFDVAKQQARREVISVFQFPDSLTKSPEYLDFSQAGKDNAILLAISAIIQGYGSPANSAELISLLSLDLENDGLLTDQGLGSRLLNNANYLIASEIRNNLSNYYSALGANSVIPAFEPYLAFFKDSSNYILNDTIVFPALVDGDQNILSFPDSIFVTNPTPSYPAYRMAANLPQGSSLMIRVLTRSGSWIPSTLFPWGRLSGSEQNWAISDISGGQSFATIARGVNTDLKLFFNNPAGAYYLVDIEYYFEGSTSPRYSKTIKITN